MVGLNEPKAVTQEQLPLARDKVRYMGEPVAVVVAQSRYLAEDACELIDVEWEPLPPITDADTALSPDAPTIDESVPGNRAVEELFEGGDVETAFAEAAHVFRKRFSNGRMFAAPLETRGIVATHDPSTGMTTMWSSNQMPHLMRRLMAGPLHLPESKFRVIAPDVGGGFGLKCHVYSEDFVIPAIARIMNRPVKWIEDRSEALAASTHAREVTIDIAIAVDDDGRFTAFDQRILGDAGAYSTNPYTPVVDVHMAGAILPGMYKVDHARFRATAALTNKCPAGAYRGTGMVVGVTARELLIEEIARELKLDPI
jgi:carbon-monoxide dehydrogenase large subunit